MLKEPTSQPALNANPAPITHYQPTIYSSSQSTYKSTTETKTGTTEGTAWIDEEMLLIGGSNQYAPFQ